jgi:hypothetical protein
VVFRWKLCHLVGFLNDCDKNDNKIAAVTWLPDYSAKSRCLLLWLLLLLLLWPRLLCCARVTTEVAHVRVEPAAGVLRVTIPALDPAMTRALCLSTTTNTFQLWSSLYWYCVLFCAARVMTSDKPLLLLLRCCKVLCVQLLQQRKWMRNNKNERKTSAAVAAVSVTDLLGSRKE